MTEAALVTGASSGIGWDLAQLLAADGHPLVLVARREDKLRELADVLAKRHGTRSLVVASDLAQPGAPAVIAAAVAREQIQVGILVNNAGFGGLAPFAGQSADEQLAMVQVNIASLTALTRLFLPAMLERRRGRILNVSSTAAFQPGPYMAVYYATKAYVQSLSEALAEELRDTGVTVTALAPGPTATAFHEVARILSTPLIAGRPLPDSMSVARAGYEGMRRGQRVVIPGLLNRLAAQGHRLLPRRVLTLLVRRLQQDRG